MWANQLTNRPSHPSQSFLFSVVPAAIFDRVVHYLR